MQVANALNYSNVDFLTVLVGGRKVLIFDLLIDSIIFDLITFILLLFFVLIDHKSVGLEIGSLRLLKSKVLLNQSLVNLLELRSLQAFSRCDFLIQYFQN